jgi:Zn-dependent protease with chaperone function
VDFFQQQDAARHRTGWLVFVFVLAVAAIVLAIYLLVFAIVGTGREYVAEGAATPPTHFTPLGPQHRVVFKDGKPHVVELPQPLPRSAPVYAAPRSGLAALWDPTIFVYVCMGTVMVIALGSLLKIAELSRGGEAVALMLGGRRIDPQTADLAERRLVNVVEEMALASGVPVPPVYVLDHEPGINAFAAGHAPQNAVVAVSRGSLTYLTRDELQGVMGHEFSHILNGDMRLNIRLIGLLNGILILAILGYFLIRAAGSSGGSSNSKEGGARVVAIFVGLGLLIIGYIGVFFGNLIKAAVSRQREYLADASAVQFTRYPGGIAGALKKIGGLEVGSRIKDAHAHECSHMFFGDAFARFSGLFATHPPLPERIHRIDPAFDGKFPPTKPLVEEAEVEEAETALERREMPPRERAAPAGPIPIDASGVLGRIGVLAPAPLAYAAALIQDTPKPLTDAAAEPYAARAVVYAVLLSRDEDLRKSQLASLQGRAEDLSYRETLKLAPLVDALSEEARLPLIDRTFPALKGLSPKQYDEFRANVEALIRADDKVDLLEYTVRSMLIRTLDVHFGRAKPVRIQYYAVAGVMEPLATVLSTLAYTGSSDEEEIQRAFNLGTSAIGRQAELASKERCTLAAFDAALGELAKTAPKVKRQIVAACASCVAADGTVTVREGELLRAITSTLGCPMPPLAAPSDSATSPTRNE